ncbi:hypothetical protein [Streptomyces sp. RKAG337]|uniref:hypothetical protein n=1 Tax=Streptomyces sp. RKAG337 TaxID=2893404 RepID=UPI00203365C3|nr:hypothetical protein [Streptomyces sp. RKAG337]MCM2424862.1 hypothetical protein [Streptomyces sp. RKAG337]
MQFRDRTLLRLLDPVERAAVLTPRLGDRLLAAAFVPSDATAGPVSAVVARQVTLLPSDWNPHQVDAQVHDVQSSRQWRMSATVPLGPPSPGADARLDLTLVAGLQGVATSVTGVEAEPLDGIADVTAVDAEIVRQDGSLPPEGNARQARRLTVLRALLGARFETADAAPLEALLDQRGLTTFESLQAYLSPPNAAQRLRLAVVEEAAPPVPDAAFKLICLVYVHAQPFDDLAGRLADVQLARARGADNADMPRPPAGMTVRAALPALLLFPEAALDDSGLPLPAGPAPPTGADALREARLTELTARLREVGVVPVPLSPLPGEAP